MRSTTSPSMPPRYRKPLVAALAAAVLAAAWRTGALEVLRDPEAVRQLLVDGGYAAWAVYLLLFTVLSAVGVPTVVFLVPMPLVWPMPVALALGLTGSMTSSLVGFWLARYVARDWVASHLPASLRRFDDKLAEKAFRTVVWIRLVLFLTPPSTWFLGLSRVPLSTYLLGTLVGGLPGIVFFVVVGGGFFGWLADRPPWVWALAAGVTVVAIVIRRFRARAHDRRDGQGDELSP